MPALWLFRYNGASYDLLLQLSQRNQQWSTPGGEMLPDEAALADSSSGLSEEERNRVVMRSVVRLFIEQAGGCRRPPFPAGIGYPVDVTLPTMGGMNTSKSIRQVKIESHPRTN